MVARSTVDVVNREANFASPLEWPMTEGPEKPVDAELEALGESGFALAIQLLGRHEDAADVVQESLRKLVHGGRFDARRGNARAWFLKVVRNGALDALRSRKLHDADAVAELTDAAPSPDDAAESGELAQIIRRELDALPTEQREIILLRDFHDLSYGEIAEVLDIAPGTVMSRLHRARRGLRERMGRFLK